MIYFINLFITFILVGEGGEEEVMSVLNNVRKPLKLGYIMVKVWYQIEIIYHLIYQPFQP